MVLTQEFSLILPTDALITKRSLDGSDEIGLAEINSLTASEVIMNMGIHRESRKPVSRYIQVVFFVGWGVVIVEGIEHYLIGEKPFNPHFLVEVFIFGVGMPLLGMLLLTLAERVEMERNQAVDVLDKHLAFSEEIKTSPRYDELMARIVQFPQKVVLTKKTCLHIYDTGMGCFRLDARSGEGPVCIPDEITRGICQACLLADPLDCTPRLCALEEAGQPEKSLNRYMMPLAYANTIVAILHFDLVSDEPLSIAQVHTLTGLASNMALAIESARLRNSQSQWMESRSSERQIIARELHDTLAQNLTYLRLKLDQFSSQDTLESIVSIRKDLKQMRDIANKAYDQVRNTLITLRPQNTIDLIGEVRSHANKVSKRANLAVAFKSSGEPVPLSTNVKRQVIYICREALYNVEKHAKAKRIDIEFTWNKKALTVKISDDGLGFNPTTANKQGSFGIALMHELAAEIDATVMIRSAHEPGVEVTIYLPIQNEYPSLIDKNS